MTEKGLSCSHGTNQLIFFNFQAVLIKFDCILQGHSASGGRFSVNTDCTNSLVSSVPRALVRSA